MEGAVSRVKATAMTLDTKVWNLPLRALVHADHHTNLHGGRWLRRGVRSVGVREARDRGVPLGDASVCRSEQAFGKSHSQSFSLLRTVGVGTRRLVRKVF